MSLPQNTPPPSSSPSKPSLRRPSGSNPQTRTLLPSPHFEDDLIVASHQSHTTPSQHFPHSSEHAIQDDSATLPPPNFRPFFTLISDPSTSEHHHPTVHYIFSDDDTDIISEAAVHALESLDPSQRPSASQSRPSANQDPDLAHLPRLPPPVNGVREHYLILDIAPSTTTATQSTLPPQASHSASPSAGPPPAPYTITSATSLSPDWAVLRTSIAAAPTIGDDDDGADDSLMLRIEGRGNDLPAEAREGESMEELIERFQRGLDEVRMVLSASAEGVGAGTGEEGQ